MESGRNRGFLWEFLCQPGTVGAVAASSAFLAREMVEGFDWPRIRTVVEYGPGTGAFTGPILQRLEPGARYVAIELNPHFIHRFQTRYPGVPVHQESAVRVAHVCHSEGIAQIDAVVCGLPWASFPDDLQTSILDATVAMLAPDGQFGTFAYLQGLLLPGALRLRNHLRARFQSVTTSRIVWRNLPPAFIYRCRGP
jgi:phosphatidylethanolamine/phosphatidyl-N-methylethanolamine N-methyltransferase